MSQLQDLLSTKDGFEKSEMFYKYLRGNAWMKGIPLIGSFELTPRCTLDCKMCYVHLRKDQMNRNELTTAQWIRLVDEACDAGMMFATLTGGECMLHPGFKEIYEHLQSRGALVSVLTNGTLLDERMAAWLAERTPQRVQISVYGSFPKGYDAMTGSADAYSKVDKAIDLLKEYEIPFNLAITVSKQMLDDFESTYRYCMSKEPGGCGVTFFTFEPRKETGRIFADFSPSLDEVVELVRIKSEVDGNAPTPYLDEKDFFDECAAFQNVNESGAVGVPCTAGRSRFSISWDGRITACSIFDFAQAFPLEDGFINAWKHINKRSCEYKKPAECLKCAYKRFCIACPAMHWQFFGEGEINPQLCSATKRLVLEGFNRL